MIGRRSATSVAALYRLAHRYTATGRSLQPSISLRRHRYSVLSPSAASVASTATINGSLPASLSSRSYFSSMTRSAYDARMCKDSHNYKMFSTTSQDSNFKLLRNLMLKIKKLWTGDDDSSKTEVLDRFGVDLTELARSSQLDPVIGRYEEIRRCIQILSRKRKCNPIIVGEPGVGKTAIVEGLAQRIAARDVPDSLKDHKLISIDMGLLHAGTSMQGELEKRIKGILKEASGIGVIIFVDELHTLVGQSGTSNVANLMKPALARGDILCIGATTRDEFRLYIETDPALERRFQPVICEPPSVKDTITFLRGLRQTYEHHHGVIISDKALVTASFLADRYITDRFLPDKAIDLIDESASKLRTLISSKPLELDVIDSDLLALELERLSLKHEGDQKSTKRLTAIESDIDSYKLKQKHLMHQWEEEKLILSKFKSLDKEELEMAKEQLADYEEKHGRRLVRNKVLDIDVIEVVSDWTGIPLANLEQSDKDKLTGMEDSLRENLIGQDMAVRSVADSIRRSRTGLADPGRPVASFLFLGPTGVGKTELVKGLTKFLFSSERALLRFDMSEYMEKHSVSRLLGAPPGYIGFEDGGKLCDAVRHRPYCVILFDEIEKAHSEVLDVLLQILDAGRLTDSKGKNVNFSNAVIFMTTNVGASLILETVDGENNHQEVFDLAKKSFRPEFINRIDEFVVFQPLRRHMIRKIVDIQLADLTRKLKNINISMRYTTEAADRISRLGYAPDLGARPVKRVIQKKVSTLISNGIVAGQFCENDTVLVDICPKDANTLRIVKVKD